MKREWRRERKREGGRVRVRVYDGIIGWCCVHVH